jgi:hypothetical protein
MPRRRLADGGMIMSTEIGYRDLTISDAFTELLSGTASAAMLPFELR